MYVRMMVTYVPFITLSQVASDAEPYPCNPKLTLCLISSRPSRPFLLVGLGCSLALNSKPFLCDPHSSRRCFADIRDYRFLAPAA